MAWPILTEHDCMMEKGPEDWAGSTLDSALEKSDSSVQKKSHGTGRKDGREL